MKAAPSRFDGVRLCNLMNAICDIETAQDVKRLVDAFYAKVNCDELLAPIFNETANVDWSTHLPTMYRFWESMLFRSGNYQGAPFPKHAVLPVQQAHFQRWVTLFAETVDENFAGPKRAKKRKAAPCVLPTRSRAGWVY
jgi:hemoglobin